jgi:hypothetical protein
VLGPHAIIPAFWRLRQEDGAFEASLIYVVRPCLDRYIDNQNILTTSEKKRRVLH